MKLRSVYVAAAVLAVLTVCLNDSAFAQKKGGGKEGGRPEGNKQGGGKPAGKSGERPPGGGNPERSSGNRQGSPSAENHGPAMKRPAGQPGAGGERSEGPGGRNEEGAGAQRRPGGAPGAANNPGQRGNEPGARNPAAGRNPAEAANAARPGTRPANGAAMNDFMGGSGQHPNQAAAAAGRYAGGNAAAGAVNPARAGTAANYATDAAGWMNHQNATGAAVRATSADRYAGAYASGAYRAGAVGGYPYAAAGYAAGTRAASYAGVGAFLGANWASANQQPVYYAYGNGGNVHYENNNVYVDGQQVATAAEYAQQASALVAAAPAADAVTDSADDWMTLGVFALTQEGVSDSNVMIELAVNKEGVIGGTYHNQGTGKSRALKGTADPQTQRVAVGFADGKNPDVVLETGMYNLTKDEAPGLLHHGEQDSQPVLLVRLPANDDSGANNDNPAGN